jgi:hypothetical protein
MRALDTLVVISLPIIVAFGCRSSSPSSPSSYNDGSADLPRGSGPSNTPDAPAAVGSCTVHGRTYEINQAFVDSCITWLCTGAEIVQQVSGSVCTDARTADVPTARTDARAVGIVLDGTGSEAATRSDVRAQLDEGAARDVSASEAVKRDAQLAVESGRHLDGGTPDEPLLKIDGPPIDGLLAEDAAPAGCLYGDLTYAVGESFARDCNTCFCRASADVVCTNKVCALDGGLGMSRDPLISSSHG